MGKNKCLVPNCENLRQSSKHSFFKFPKEDSRRQKWLQILKFENIPLYYHSAICQDHFKIDQFSNHSRTRLKPDAIPFNKEDQSASLLDSNSLQSMPRLKKQSVLQKLKKNRKCAVRPNIKKESQLDVCETKFNVLLLLRNRYPEGLETKLMQRNYKKFFGVELNAAIFNPNASDPLLDNIDFLGKEILVHRSSRHQKIYFKAKCGCSDEAMQFLADSVNTKRKNLGNNYSLPDMSLHTFGMNGNDIEVEEADPLELFNDNENPCTSGVSQIEEEMSNEFPNNTIQQEQETMIWTQADSSVLNGYTLPVANYSESPNNTSTYIVINNSEYQSSPTAASETNTGESSSLRIQNYVFPSKVSTSGRKFEYPCLKGCKKTFDKEMFQKIHSKNCVYEPPTKCPAVKCDKMFTDNSLLKFHVKFNHGECPVPGCGKILGKLSSLSAHVNLVHGHEKKLQCSVPNCFSEFRTPDRLKIHENRCRFKHESFEEMQLVDRTNATQDDEADNAEFESTVMFNSEYIDLSSLKTEDEIILD